VDDAIHATRAAAKEGYVPGGGVAFLRAIKAVTNAGKKAEGDEAFGYQIVAEALRRPTWQIAMNAGVDGDLVVEKVLEGSDGRTAKLHLSQCAPCHLPDIDLQIDWSLSKPPAAAVCERCGGDDSEQQGKLIFCDNCNGAWHLGCHQPRLNRTPPGTWVCQPCLDQGITLEAVKALQQATDQQAAQQQRPEKHLPSELRASMSAPISARRRW
jgi:hypothetical protein